MQCTECKYANPEENAFCGHCGRQLRAADGPLEPLREFAPRFSPEAVQAELVNWVRARLRFELKHWATRAGAAAMCALLILYLWQTIRVHRWLTSHEAQVTEKLTSLQAHEHQERVALEAERKELGAARLRSANSSGSQPPAVNLHEVVAAEIRSQLDERVKGQKSIEIETAEAIKNDIVSWTKDMGFFVGIPAALLFALYGFLGVKTFADLKKAATDAQNNFDVELQNARSEARARTKEISELARAATERMAQFDEEKEEFDQQVEEFSKRVSTSITKVGELVTTVGRVVEKLPKSLKTRH